MSSTNGTSEVVSVDEQGFEQTNAGAVDEEGFEVVEETPEFRASVDQEVQAKVDANHPDGRVEDGPDHMVGKTLAQEERIKAREAELAHISQQATLSEQEGRAERTREVVTEQCGREDEAEPDVAPQAVLTKEELAEVNRQAARINERVDGGWSRAVVAQELAKRAVGRENLTEAVFEVLDEQRAVPGTVVPIAEVPDVPVGEVTVEGVVTELWASSSPRIQQVGLIEDESGRTKFTVWERSNQTIVREGETIRFRAAAKNWYQGRCSLALTGWSAIEFPKRGRWWDQ
ncbi:DNA-binding protein [Halomarina litorea]|uniref:DNA-binding protein n=1 Tax=Halomarina litorea TaxID=2961595 RepID=UPI0020C3FF48|nr:DNA-binding protein [Halomarina sp. BCD28]